MALPFLVHLRCQPIPCFLEDYKNEFLNYKRLKAAFKNVKWIHTFIVRCLFVPSEKRPVIIIIIIFLENSCFAWGTLYKSLYEFRVLWYPLDPVEEIFKAEVHETSSRWSTKSLISLLYSSGNREILADPWRAIPRIIPKKCRGPALDILLQKLVLQGVRWP